MNRKIVLTTVSSLLLLLPICILFIDRPLAEWLNTIGRTLTRISTKVLTILEVIFGFTISKYLYGAILWFAAIVVRVTDKSWHRARLFLFIGTTHIVSRLVAGVLKNVFHRSRPFQYIQDKGIADFFAEGGSSFPSGHVAHFFGLFLPLVFLFPKYKWWWLLLPFFVLLQRVLQNDHYLGDAIASLVIAYIFTCTFYFVFKIDNVVTDKVIN